MNTTINRQKQAKRLELDVYLVKHCNLRCRGCIRFANTAKPQLYDFEQYKKDIRVFKDFSYVPEHVTLSGGEPLVVDNILEYIAAVKEIYPECLISIFTNATLLKKLCNDEAVKFMIDNEVTICYTRYANYILNSLNSIMYLEEHGISVGCIGDLDFNAKHDKPIKAEMTKLTLLAKDSIDSSDKSNLATEHFTTCESDLLQICDSKIYTCGRGNNIKYLNKKYNLDYPEDNYIKVSDITCNDDLLKFSSQPCALCTYCGNVNPDNCQTVPYSTDEAELTDYLA